MSDWSIIFGTLTWLGLSTKDGSLLSKHIHTVEPVGEKATGKKISNEDDYGETLIVFVLTIGAVMTTAGVFFGRIREIKFGGGAVVLDDPPEKDTKKAKDEADSLIDAAADLPATKKEKAKELARTLYQPQLALAYSTTPVGIQSGFAESIGKIAAQTAIEAVK